MNLLIINPNASDSMRQQIEPSCREVQNGYQGVCPTSGPQGAPFT